MTKTRRILLLLIILILSVFLTAGCTLSTDSEDSASTPASGTARISYLDIGQGDACCIQTSDGSTVLIDTGDTDQKDTLISELNELGVDQIDVMILSHAHADHIGGARTVIKNFSVGKIIISPQAASTYVYKKLLNDVQSNNIPISKGLAGQNFTVGDCSFSIVGPTDESTEKELNNTSVVVRMTHGNDAFLFTGDAEKKEENEILDTGADISCDVLKVGHHGSTSATSDEWLDACGSRLQTAVISVGKDNDYGLPKQKTIDKLTNRGISVFRTDDSGTITVVSTGNGVQVSAEK